MTNRRYPGKRPPPKRVTVQTKTVNKIVDKRMNTKSEHKELNVQGTGSSSYAWTLSPVISTFIPQGNGDSQRIGDKIRIKQVDFKASYTYADSSNTCRVVLIRWLANNTPSASQIFTDDSSVYAPLSHYTTEYKGALFQVIWDSHRNLSSVGPGVASVFKSKKLGGTGKQVHFNSGSTTVASGELYLCHATDSSAASHPTLTYNLRMIYSDF